MKYILPFTIFTLFIIFRLIPYLTNFVPTGYDSGIYMFVLKTFPVISPWLVSSYNSALFFLPLPFVYLGLSPETIIVPLALGVQIIFFGCCLWAVTKITNCKTALICLFLVSVSPIQLRTYWFFYLKYILSIATFIAFLAMLGKRSYAKASIFAILTGITHLLTGGILLTVSFIDIIMEKKEKKKKLVMYLCIVFGIFLFYLPILFQGIFVHITPTLENLFSLNWETKQAQGGTFYPLITSFFLSIVYLPLAIHGLRETIKQRKEEYKPFLITLIVTVFLIIIHVSFFRRIVVITDMILIIYAAIGFSLVKDIKRFYIALLIIFATIFMIKTSDKLISQQNVEELSEQKNILETNYLLSTGKEDTAWLLGYTNTKVIAWGYGEYDIYWNSDQWRNFFDPFYPIEKKILLFKLLPPHSFIYISDHIKTHIPKLINSPYLIPISAHIYRITNPRE